MVSELNTANALQMADSGSSSKISSPSASVDAPLFTSTLPSAPQVVGIKLDGPNYLAWVAQFMPILRTHEVLGIVDGSESCPPKFLRDSSDPNGVNPAYAVWQKKDQLVLSWILCSLSPTILSSMYGLNTSRSAWAYLAGRYADQSRSRISHLKRQLQALQQGSKTCTEYLNQAKTWADQLAAVGKPVDDDDLISFIISGLNPIYHSFIAAFSLANRSCEMSFTDFQSELLSHEILIESQNHQTVPHEAPAFALYSNKPDASDYKQQPTRFPSHSQGLTRPPNPHYSKSSYPTRGPARSSGYRNGPSSGLRNYPTTNAARPPSSDSPGLPPRSPCQICGKINHRALDCYHRMDYSYQGRLPPPQLSAMVAQTNAAYDTQEWLADSGANTHVTASHENIADPQPFDGRDTVGVGNGAGLIITSIGSSFVSSDSSHDSTFHLKDIVHCPKASANLVSINKFCRDNKCFFILTDSYFCVKDNKTGTTLLQGPSENGLYPLHFHHPSANKMKAFTAFLGVKTTDMVWHHRLGHPSASVFQHLHSHQHLPVSGSINKSQVCDSCQLGKAKQLPFSDSARVSSAPLELIHSDVWTSPVHSMSGCRFYVIFVDDFSSFTWLYPLINKSEVFTYFVKFKLFVEKQFSTSIKQLQTDNGGEYTSTQFKTFLGQNGIFQRLTCPHTSQQNGIAERKHRHIVEMGLTLLAQSGLPTKFWVESFLTSTYLINRLPTKVLHNESPFSKLFGKPPDYSFLKVFGSLCYPLLRPYGQHKLSFRSKPCIFLGYCLNQRGYRCFDPHSHKVYISRHVVFDEMKFPAKDMLLTSGSCRSTVLVDDSSITLPSLPSPPRQNHTMPFPAAPVLSSDSLQLAQPLSLQPSAPLQPDPPMQLPDSLPSISSSLQSDLAPSSPLPHSASPSLEHATSPNSPSPSPFSDSVLSSPPSTQLSPVSPVNPPRMLTRSQTGHPKPKAFPDFTLYHSVKYPLKVLQAVRNPLEPTSYKQAAPHPEWLSAM
jgi:hypothetical protein